MSQVPALREALQDVAERRYGRRHVARRQARLALVPIAAAAVAIVVHTAPTHAPDEKAAAKTHTVRITTLPPRPRAPFRIPRADLMPQPAAAAAYAAAAHTSANEGRLVRAWSIPGVEGAAVFLTRDSNAWCVATREPAGGDFPGQWAAACQGAELFRDYGASLVVGDTYVGVLGPSSTAPQYRVKGGATRELTPAAGGLLMVQGAQDGARVMISGKPLERIELGRDARYECSDGTSVVVRVDLGHLRWDPCDPDR